MAGNQSRGLIAASKTRGWDPTQIPGFGSLTDTDKDQGNLTARGVPAGDTAGALPGLTIDAFRDGYDIPTLSAESSPTWTCPDYSREMKNRRTVNADIEPGR